MSEVEIMNAITKLGDSAMNGFVVWVVFDYLKLLTTCGVAVYLGVKLFCDHEKKPVRRGETNGHGKD